VWLLLRHLGLSPAFFTRPSSKLAEQTMKFESISGKQRSRRSKSGLQAPAAVESLEVRSLMTVLSPTGTVRDATPTITWEAVDNATSYDLWVSDREQQTALFIQRNILITNFTPATDLNLGKTRTWVRANFADGSSSPWSLPTDFIVQVAPTVTGPVNPALSRLPTKLADTTPTITWTSPPGALRFEIYLSDQTSLTSKIITVKNLTPVLDADGFAQFDSNHEIIRQEVRSYELTDNLVMGSYRVFVRSLDDGGRLSPWSAAYNFEVAPPTVITRPTGVTFQNPPLLEWHAVAGATDYDVVLARAAAPNTPLYNLKFRTGTSYQIPRTLMDGDYVFWVRAHRRVTGRPETVGIWSLPSNFSTIRVPVITGPAGIESGDPNQRIVTDARPTVEWLRIDKAARYNIWVERANTKATYLRTTSSTNFYQFEQDIQPGKYMVWVQAVSTTGKMTGWSTPYSFEATGGVPIITFPAAGTNVVPIPDITWTPVPDAKSYDIWIAWVGEDFDYIRVSGIALTTFAPTDPLPTGTYRVWVRAVKSDGTVLPWSKPVNFTVALNDLEQPAGEVPELLAALLPTTSDVQADSVPDAAPKRSMDPGTSDVSADSGRMPSESIAMLSAPTVFSAMTPETEGFIQQLAEECMSVEWWMPQGTET